MDSFFTMRRLLVCMFAFLFVIAGCTRISSTELGNSLIPSADGVTTLDTTFSVITDTYDDLDTIRVYKTDNHLLGVINNDPLFGKTNANLFFEVGASNYPFAMSGAKDSTIVDSAVLILSCRGFYGDSLQPLKLNVYEINSLMDQFRDYPVNYPSVAPVTYGASTLAATATVDIRRISDSVYNRFEAAKNQIRIKLNKSFANRMILSYDSTNAYKSDSVFRTYFNGFAVIPDPSLPANALLNINLADTNTKLALYYNTATAGATTRDTVVTYFRFNANSGGHANFVTRNRTGSEVVKHVSVTPKSDSLVYIQAMPGTGVRIKVPGLQSLSNRLIHRAELITEQVPDNANLTTTDVQMAPPRYLLLSSFDSVYHHKRNIPNDYSLSSSGPNISDFGGYSFFKSIQGYSQVAAYTFNITRYVQGIATRTDTAFNMILTAPSNDSLYYSAPYPNQNSRTLYNLTPMYGNDVGNGRVRLGGGTNVRFRMRLRVVYSKL